MAAHYVPASLYGVSLIIIYGDIPWKSAHPKIIIQFLCFVTNKLSSALSLRMSATVSKIKYEIRSLCCLRS